MCLPLLHHRKAIVSMLFFKSIMWLFAFSHYFDSVFWVPLIQIRITSKSQLIYTKLKLAERNHTLEKELLTREFVFGVAFFVAFFFGCMWIEWFEIGKNRMFKVLCAQQGNRAWPGTVIEFNESIWMKRWKTFVVKLLNWCSAITRHPACSLHVG